MKLALAERLTRNWPLRAQPYGASSSIVSFSFDDFPRSAAQAGAQVLNEFGVKGTYFISGSRAGLHLDGLDQFTEDDLLSVAEAGHEIGCHTFGHLRLPSVSRTEIHDDLLRNQDFVRAVLGDYRMSSFAYPFGDVNFSSKNLVSRLFPFCRGIWSRVNKRPVDFAQLRAVPLDCRLEGTRVDQILDEAKNCNGWVIFFTHDISDQPSPYGCRPEELARVVNDVLDRGIKILPIKHAGEEWRKATAQ